MTIILIKTIALLISLFATLTSLKNNKDIFSPSKIYLLYFIFFYCGIYYSETEIQIVLTYICLMTFVAISTIADKTKSTPPPLYPSIKSIKNITISVWLLTLPGIAVKVFFIYNAGGIDSYIASLAFRVRDWAGQGHLTSWFFIIPALNLTLYSYIFSNPETRKKTSYRTSYALHFIIFLSISLLTASRSFVATTIFGLIVSHHYLVKPIKIKNAAIAFFTIAIFASIMGTARNGFGNKEFTSNQASMDLELTHLRYGTIPLDLILNADFKPLGPTIYISLATNLIPRNIYPNKPETPAIIFTKIFSKEDYGGLSNLATGVITEAVMSFGHIFGVIIGMGIIFTLLATGIIIYKRKILHRKSPANVMIYFYAITLIGRISYSESTESIYTTFFYGISPMLICIYTSYILNAFTKKKRND